MFCRNCGAELNENAVICVRCGCQKGKGTTYCPHCGEETNPDAAVCMSCGCAVSSGGEKSKLAAGLLGIFLGTLGIHNFYLGYTKKAIIQVLLGTVGSLLLFIGPCVSGIWGLIDGIMILSGKISVDGKGIPLQD